MEKHMIFDYKYIKALNKTEASIYNYIIHNMGKLLIWMCATCRKNLCLYRNHCTLYKENGMCGIQWDEGRTASESYQKCSAGSGCTGWWTDSSDHGIQKRRIQEKLHKFAMYISHAKMLILSERETRAQLPAMQQDISRISVILRLVWMIRFIRRSSIEALERL